MSNHRVLEVEWGRRRWSVWRDRPRRRKVASADELDELLDAIDAEGRASGLPQSVDLISSLGEGTLSIVVGDDRSYLHHVPADGDLPYYESVGEQDADGEFVFFMYGDHHTEAPLRNTVKPAVARAAARHFFETGALDPRVDWSEV